MPLCFLFFGRNGHRHRPEQKRFPSNHLIIMLVFSVSFLVVVCAQQWKKIIKMDFSVRVAIVMYASHFTFIFFPSRSLYHFRSSRAQIKAAVFQFTQAVFINGNKQLYIRNCSEINSVMNANRSMYSVQSSILIEQCSWRQVNKNRHFRERRWGFFFLFVWLQTGVYVPMQTWSGSVDFLLFMCVIFWSVDNCRWGQAVIVYWMD